MKAKINSILFLTLILGYVLTSCERDKTDSPKNDDAVKRYLEFQTKMNAFSANKGKMNGFMNIIGASQLHLNLRKNTLDKVDSTSVDSTNYWDYWTCAKVTEFNNEDGTHTTILDYGDGCDQFGAMTKGKITYIWKVDGNDYYSKVLYENYYSYGMKMDGYTEYNFKSDGNSYFHVLTSDSSVDSVDFYWSGSSNGKDDMTMVDDYGGVYTYKSDYSSKWDKSSFTILKGDYSYSSEKEKFKYIYRVAKPLIYSYECSNVWVPVSGIENIHYINTEEIYDFEVDYGDGSCDNLAIITENEKSSIIDFGDLLIICFGKKK